MPIEAAPPDLSVNLHMLNIVSIIGLSSEDKARRPERQA